MLLCNVSVKYSYIIKELYIVMAIIQIDQLFVGHMLSINIIKLSKIHFYSY